MIYEISKKYPLYSKVPVGVLKFPVLSESQSKSKRDQVHSCCIMLQVKKIYLEYLQHF